MADRSTPRFTRRDFEFLADKVAPHLHWATAIEAIADELARTNKRFDRDKWTNRAYKNWEAHAKIGRDKFDDEIPY
tara:strand:+ start:284 stop:511 length:228 start_codon:yes stop_codon:yes gene_type:complete